MRRELARTRTAIEASALEPRSNGFINLRNKLDQAAHTRTTSLIGHEKNEIHRSIVELKDDTKVLAGQLVSGQSELFRLKARRETLANRLRSDREELTHVNRQLGMVKELSAGTVATNTRRCVDAHAAGLGILKDDFDYHAMFRRPADSFMAYSTFMPKVPKSYGKS